MLHDADAFVFLLLDKGIPWYFQDQRAQNVGQVDVVGILWVVEECQK